MRKGVIPAAGLGTRLLPATKAVPKELLPVGGRPVIEHVVAEAVASGLEAVLIILARGKEALADHFDAAPELEQHLTGRSEEWLLATVNALADSIDIMFIRQPQPRGLGDAVALARTFVGEEPFAVLLPDELFFGDEPCLGQLLAAYAEVGCSVVGCRPVPADHVNRYGIIDPDPGGEFAEGGLVRARDLIEKPALGTAPSNLAVIGRYILQADIFDALIDLPPGHGGEIQLTDGLRKLARERGVYGCEVHGRRYDVGNQLGWLLANVDAALADPDLAGPFTQLLRNRCSELTVPEP